MPETQMIQIEKPPTPAIITALAALVGEAKTFQVLDIVSDEMAKQRIEKLRNGERAIAEYFEPARRKADEAKKEILRARDGLIAPIAEARSIYDRKAREYEAAALKKAEEERIRLQAIAREQEVERKIEEAVAAEAAGDEVGADAILSEEVTVPVVAVEPAIARVSGVSSRTTWSAEVHDSECCDPSCMLADHYSKGFMQLVRHVAAHPEWMTMLEPCYPNLNRLAVAQRKNLAIPGVRAVAKEGRSIGKR